MVRLPQTHAQVAARESKAVLCLALARRPAAPQKPEALPRAEPVEGAKAQRVGLPPREEMRVRALVQEVGRAAPRVPGEG